MQLPLEIWLRILSNLSQHPRALLQIRRVNRALRQLVARTPVELRSRSVGNAMLCPITAAQSRLCRLSFGRINSVSLNMRHILYRPAPDGGEVTTQTFVASFRALGPVCPTHIKLAADDTGYWTSELLRLLSLRCCETLEFERVRLTSEVIAACAGCTPKRLIINTPRGRSLEVGGPDLIATIGSSVTDISLGCVSQPMIERIVDCCPKLKRAFLCNSVPGVDLRKLTRSTRLVTLSVSRDALVPSILFNDEFQGLEASCGSSPPAPASTALTTLDLSEWWHGESYRPVPGPEMLSMLYDFKWLTALRLSGLCGWYEGYILSNVAHDMKLLEVLWFTPSLSPLAEVDLPLARLLAKMPRLRSLVLPQSSLVADGVVDTLATQISVLAADGYSGPYGAPLTFTRCEAKTPAGQRALMAGNRLRRPIRFPVDLMQRQ